MVRNFRRGALAAVIALSLAPLAACATGNDAQTLEVKPDTASASVGVIKVQSAFVLTQAGGGPATVSARLFNNGSTPQTLQSVTVTGAPAAKLSGAGGTGAVTVPAHGSVLLGGKGNPSAVLTGGMESLDNGDVQKAVFVFSATGPVSVAINVTPATGYLEPYGPASLPTPTTPAAAPAPAKRTASAAATPTVTPTTTTTP